MKKLDEQYSPNIGDLIFDKTYNNIYKILGTHGEKVKINSPHVIHMELSHHGAPHYIYEVDQSIHVEGLKEGQYFLIDENTDNFEELNKAFDKYNDKCLKLLKEMVDFKQVYPPYDESKVPKKYRKKKEA